MEVEQQSSIKVQIQISRTSQAVVFLDCLYLVHFEQQRLGKTSIREV